MTCPSKRRSGCRASLKCRGSARTPILPSFSIYVKVKKHVHTHTHTVKSRRGGVKKIEKTSNNSETNVQSFLFVSYYAWLDRKESIQQVRLDKASDWWSVKVEHGHGTCFYRASTLEERRACPVLISVRFCCRRGSALWASERRKANRSGKSNCVEVKWTGRFHGPSATARMAGHTWRWGGSVPNSIINSQ